MSMTVQPERIFAEEENEVVCVQFEQPKELDILFTFASLKMRKTSATDQNVKAIMVGELWDDQGTMIWDRDQPQKFLYLRNKVNPKAAESYIPFLEEEGISMESFYEQEKIEFSASMDDFSRREITETNCTDLIPRMKAIQEKILNQDKQAQEEINELSAYLERANLGDYASGRYFDCDEKSFITKEEAINQKNILRIGGNRSKLFLGEMDEFGNESGQGILREYVNSRFTEEPFQYLSIKVGTFKHGFLNGPGKSYAWHSGEDIARMVEGEFKNGVLVGQTTWTKKPWTDEAANSSILMDRYCKYSAVPASEEKMKDGKILIAEFSDGSKTYMSEEYARVFGKRY